MVSSLVSTSENSTAPSSSRTINNSSGSSSNQRQSTSRTASSSQGRVTKKRLYEVVSNPFFSEASDSRTYKVELERWISRAGLSEYPSRERAAELCKNCVLKNDDMLEFPAGYLTQLPPLPKNIKKLKVIQNELRNLPDHWPANLQEIDVSRNKIRKIEGGNLPRNLRSLNFSHNETQRISGPFFPELRKIVAKHNKFTELPNEWPANLQELHLHRSGLGSFPQNLPQELKVLDLSSNSIGEIGQDDLPYGLERLNLSKTGIASIPEELPEGLKVLDLSGNYFDYLPEFLPQSLIYVNLSNSNLEMINDCLKGLSANAEVDLISNDLSVEALEDIQDMLNNSRGPYFKLSEQDKSLRQAVEMWLEGEEDVQAPRIEAWRDIQSRQHSRRDAQAFSTFLMRLRETQEFKNQHSQTQFIHRVQTLLNALEADRPLRNTCISIACEALETCNDRIAISFDNMELEVINSDAEKGKYTQDELFELGGKMMRLNDLNEIALAKLASLESAEMNLEVDPVEVLLAYRSGLAEKLNLPNQTKSMFFSQVSDVKKSDLRAAKREVERLQQDENHVIDFFVQWRPWQMHLVRTEKADFEKLAVEMKESKDKLLDAHFELDELNQNMTWLEYRRRSQDLLDQNNIIDLGMPDRLRRQLTRAYILKSSSAQAGSSSH